MALGARWWTLWAVLLGLPMAIFLTLMAVPQWDRLEFNGDFHFWVVSATALFAALACIVVIGMTKSLRESRLLFLGLAFLSIAAVFAVHGLDTPGHIHSVAVTELKVSSWLSVFLAACFISLSVIDLPEKVEDFVENNGNLIFGAATLALGTFIGLSMTSPNWLHFLPSDNRDLQLAATAVTLAIIGFAAVRYFQAFLFARLPSQWGMVCVMVMLLEVTIALNWGRGWHLSWWLYHAVYVGSFLVLFGSWALEMHRAGSVNVIAEGLSMRDAVSQLNHGYEAPIASLVDAIEWKDLYTLGHVRRVASYSLMMGKELGLTTLELRTLALGAQMHDVGKIGVPDRILTKPGPLTDEEFEIIKEHVGRGYEIAVGVKALASAVDAIRYHHERWDGSGYPTGLAGPMIPLNARIVSVADAFDAMTSGRVYQKAVTRDEGFAELRRCSGTHFDPQCVEAFVAALSRVKDVSGIGSSGGTSSSSGMKAAA